MIAITVGTALFGLLALWLLGGLVLRIGGLLLALAGAFGMALGGDAGCILLVAVGGLLWLGGHWHYALRHHAYKSPLAHYVFCRWAPPWLDPTRNWAVAVQADRGDRASAGRRRRAP